MKELQKRILDRLKKLKGIDDEKSDDVFLFAVDTAIQEILSYCHCEVDDWPIALDNTAVLMSIDLINETSFSFNAAEAEGEVKSLSEGDFSIAKETKAEAYQKMMQAPSFARNYSTILNRFRRLR
ncbi:hypothetical protein EQ871_14700 [Enterococcus casseliflavus]|uniref:hypothetical protein n=1 Tax=Enterococcus casseliflavus TaxID=37734 RepID=UPI000FFB4042|nr:hypothetical protein [Enterococcus casseliflavus]RXA60325.1 hypothetical protein EQ871_14700 [Enterococcus casseliflavus]